MLESGEGVSDCLFINGKPPLVEHYGKLHELPMEEAGATLHPTHINAMADLLIGDSERLRSDLTSTGSCDTSYSLGHIARFRVNIYRQNGHLGIVMRKLQSEIPTLEGLGLPLITTIHHPISFDRRIDHDAAAAGGERLTQRRG